MDIRYLPIGSVVLLEEGEKRVMIYGRLQKAVDTGQTWDYVACLYPEGNIGPEYTYLFNHDQIARVYFLGFQDVDEVHFNKLLSDAQSSSATAVQATQ